MIEADWALIQQMVHQVPPKPFTEHSEGLKLFHHNLGTDIDPQVYDIIDSSATHSTKVEITNYDNEIFINAPNSLLKPVNPSKKARTKKPVVQPREYLMRIPVSEEIVADLVIFRDCTRLRANIFDIIGPYIHLKPGRLEFVFGVYLKESDLGDREDLSIGQNGIISRVMARIFKNDAMNEASTPLVTISDIFSALTVPKPFSQDLFEVPGVLTPLHNFQCQTVRWCLLRESRELIGSEVRPRPPERCFGGWYKIDDFWVNPYTAAVQKDTPEDTFFPLGGLLAEEMGLGKTLEVIALSQLNKRQDTGVVLNERTGDYVQKIKATLVIEPSGILEQWVSEIQTHAPDLVVCTYSGKGAVSPDDLARADIVLASYSTIATEIYAASFNPGRRNTRHWRDRDDLKSVRSSLVQVQFWRVVLDEVQMIHAGVNNAARVAGLIPRVNAWAVTGTPVKNSINDFRGQLSFLQAKPFGGKYAYQCLLTVPDDFKRVVQDIGTRHTKHMLRDQLQLPPQKRKLVMLQFSQMERLFYETVQERYHLSDNPTDAEASALLVRLRQACCIPSSYESSAMGNAFELTLSIEQALDQLTAEANTKIVNLTRQRIGQWLELAQLFLVDGDYEKAVTISKDQIVLIEKEIQDAQQRIEKDTNSRTEVAAKIKAQNDIIYDVRVEMEKIRAQFFGEVEPEVVSRSDVDGDTTDTEAPELRDNETKIAEKDTKLCEKTTHSDVKALVKKEKADLGTSEDEAPKSETPIIKREYTPGVDEDINHVPEFRKLRFGLIEKLAVRTDLELQEERAATNITAATNHINACKELLHRAFFFLGTSFFRMGQREDLEETEKAALAETEQDFYNKAEAIRSELLQVELEEFLQQRGKLKQPNIFAYDAPENIYEEFMNKQAQKLLEIQKDLAEILASDLLETDPDDPDSYGKSLIQQDKAFIYLNAINNILDSRKKVLENKDMNTQTQRRRNKMFEASENELILERTVEGNALEAQLRKELSAIREPLAKHEREQKRRIGKVNDARLRAAERESRYGTSKKKIQESIVFEHLEAVDHREIKKLEADVKLWRREANALSKVFNARMNYFKRLQVISDRVREPELQNVAAAISRKESSIEQTNADTRRVESQLKYISQLEIQNPDERDNKDKHEDDLCPICQETYIQGSFTTCGHRTCSVCLRSWVSQNPICPICKASLTAADIFQFKYGDLKEESSDDTRTRTDDLGNDVYTHISSQLFNDIVREPIKKSYGVKIDMIVRHIILLKRQDPDVQIVVFTQWQKMLHTLTNSLIHHGVRVLRKTQPKSVVKFRSDPDVTCFMLHTSNDSAGLTLTNAKHVILCEPLLNTAIELQAISRIHRIGQNRRTTVWLFAVQDTVEQQILRLSTERRVEMAHKKQRNAKTMEAESEELVESEILESTMGKMVDRASGSEVLVGSDLKRVLEIE